MYHVEGLAKGRHEMQKHCKANGWGGAPRAIPRGRDIQRDVCYLVSMVFGLESDRFGAVCRVWASIGQTL